MTSGVARWVTIGEAVRLTGKSKRTIWRWVDAGKVTINRDVTPFVVDVSGVAILADDTTPPDDTEALTVRVATLERDITTLERERDDLREDRDRWWQAHMMALANTQRLLEAAPTERAWRWPWQKGED